MRKLVGVLVTVTVGILGLISAVSSLTSLPEFFAFFSGRIAWLNASLGYEAELLLGVGALAAACWAFDMEIDREKGPRKPVAASMFVCVLLALALVVSSFERLDSGRLQSIGLGESKAVAGPPKGGGAAEKGPRRDGPRTTPDSDSPSGESAPPESGEPGFDPGASSSKGTTDSSRCTCPTPSDFDSLPPRGGGGAAAQPEEDEEEGGEFFDEAGEEAQEAAEEAQEEAREAAEDEREEAELAELGP